jgi:hypothetical protein
MKRSEVKGSAVREGGDEPLWKRFIGVIRDEK